MMPEVARRNEEAKTKHNHDNNDNDNDNSPSISYRQLLHELQIRIQWRFVLASTLAGMGVKYIAFAKPRVVGLLFDAVTQHPHHPHQQHDDINNHSNNNTTEPITQSTLWAQYFRPLLLYTLLHSLLLSLQDYFKYTALHRFHQSVQCDMISNLLRQEEEYLHSIPAGGGGFTHLMEVECRCLPSIINEFLPRFIYGLFSIVCGIRSLLTAIDGRSATTPLLLLLLLLLSTPYRVNPSVRVLNGIDLHLTRGKVVALCGESGGGKSTVTRLIQRFYDPIKGSIELNDMDIRTINLAWLRKQIRVIDQDPVLPDLTIYENIALGLGEDDMEKGKDYVYQRVVEAATLADAHNFIITKCEKGYDTPVRLLSRLSGGERQRIAIARALISHAPILICDEITSSLDAETEKTVLETLSRAMEGTAVLLIAHRLSTIRHADEIAFLERGTIVERGTHEELVRLNGRYSSYLKTLNGSAETFG